MARKSFMAIRKAERERKKKAKAARKRAKKLGLPMPGESAPNSSPPAINPFAAAVAPPGEGTPSAPAETPAPGQAPVQAPAQAPVVSEKTEPE